MVHQQIRALSIHDTAVARQKGYPQRVCFQEFLRRFNSNLFIRNTAALLENVFHHFCFLILLNV